jgi:hypothetical protein
MTRISAFQFLGIFLPLVEWLFRGSRLSGNLSMQVDKAEQDKQSAIIRAQGEVRFVCWQYCFPAAPAHMCRHHARVLFIVETSVGEVVFFPICTLCSGSRGEEVGGANL